MGHQISKQRNQQMSDDQPMTNSIEAHIEPSTSSAKELQVKIGKTRRFASNAKKLKKQSIVQRNDDGSNSNGKNGDVNSYEVNSNQKSTAPHLTTSQTNQERNAGSVVITIRLLKMESARNFDVNCVGCDATQIEYSNHINNNSGNNNNHNNNNSNRDNCSLMTSRSQTHSASDMPSNNVHLPLNQNNSFNTDSNNMNVNVNVNDKQCAAFTVAEFTNNRWVNCDMIATAAAAAAAATNCDRRQPNSIKSLHVNNALRSEATICDNVQRNCTSQSEQSQRSNASLVNGLTHPLNAIRLTESSTIKPAASSSSSSSTTSTTASQPHTTTTTPTPRPIAFDIKIPDNTSSAFIPSSLIGTVSPYPHHIPFANIIRSDCLNATADEHSSLCQHAKKAINGTGIGNSGNGGVSKQNCSGAKESKELKSKKPNWGIKLNCTKLKGIKSLSSSLSSEPASPSPSAHTITANESTDNTNVETNTGISAQQPTALLCTSGGNVIIVTTDQQQPWFASDEYSIEDCDKKAHLQRAIEIAENVEPSPGFISTSSLQSLHSMSSSNLQLLPGSVNDANGKNANTKSPVGSSHWTMVCSNSPALRIMLPSLLQHAEDMSRIHSQVDYVHCLVPDLMQITNCSFYWGKMDRYEAERLLENKPEGTFLLRDSAQEEFLFSVSFRKYGRSLHARIEQFNHRFSFDCHDSSVYTSKTVTGLLEHYKDPGCVMFFEPALTIPLNRNFVFSLQQLCRATIVSHTTYDGVNEICLPKKLKSYLKEYHYKQHVRVKRFDEPIYSTS